MFLYYFPRLTQAELTRERIKDSPLAGVLADVLRTPRTWDRNTCTITIHAHGPDGGHGAILAALPAGGDRHQLLGLVGMRAGQTWKPRGEDSAGIWIGYGDTPAPETLRRLKLTDGYEYELGDDRDWLCPILRRPNGTPLLETVWGLDHGQLKARVPESLAGLWALAGLIWDVYWKKQLCQNLDWYHWATRLLAVNYRLGPEEVDLLGLITSDNYPDIIKAAIDVPAIEAFLVEHQDEAAGEAGENPAKKNETAPTAAPSSTSPGPPEESPIMPPPAATSTSIPAT